jgi:pimeloyl-ACP methyl ester carboxylesterase
MFDTTIETRDGRTLTFRDWGDRSGRPLFYLHGSPGSRLLHGPEVDYAELGIRLITYDRPGYGGSERKPGRTVADVVPDMLDIADVCRWNRSGFWVFPATARMRWPRRPCRPTECSGVPRHWESALPTPMTSTFRRHGPRRGQ